MKGVISGLLIGRLGTALHLGTVYPRFFGNTKTFYMLIESMVVLTLATSATISVVSILFGTMFWGIGLADFPDILTVLVATMSLGLIITLITVKISFVSFKRGLDPDTIVYPAVSTVADIVITFSYIGVLTLYFSGFFGRLAILFFGLINVLLVLIYSAQKLRNADFLKTLKESVGTMVLVAFMVNITGTFLKGINNLAPARREIYTVYPALIDMMGNV